ncbi:DUF2249 domain-containing protein [Mycolicibacterium holsaticum]|uniref:DUF2249 domain-containing protein n=1 Tax=Mycolicibacterium holsaticum TaxID=152142 RepID=UPI001C7D1485|nr:DUF2249 domain-containing protein [Mycolicibacterium holsaticum]MDA4107883.1 cation-binding protein [Mycolicibacterium holsaticum DSM 44478 = JCM 12374]QZA14684.1 DUF2249 domain-containing protein [Mycolicibacterium holsaticum DSM 44478 = JCM 12374]UNC07871.1 DUF2249 domain-containing protein [Mycolicibacterium holsaticum DSM 44478 = JCM 12374]
MTINEVIVATSSADAEAAETVKNHHAELAGHLQARTEAMLSAAERGGDFEAARAAATQFLTGELLPHAAAEEARLYPAAANTERARPLIESMIAVHRVLAALVDRIRTEKSPVRAAAAGNALRVLFDAHLIDENDRILPIVAADPDVSLADALGGMHELLGGHHDAEGGHKCGCESDAEEPVLDVCEVPHSIRHATVFGAFDAVPVGGSMVLVAPHDPVPLLHQLHDRTAGRISVDYLVRGPEAWRLRLTRH